MCCSDKHFVNSSPYNQHDFVFENRKCSKFYSILKVISTAYKVEYEKPLSGPQIRVCNRNLFLFFSTKTYVVGTQKNSLDEMFFLSTHNICLN